MIGKQAFQDSAEVGRGAQISPLIELAFLQSWPICNNATAFDCSAIEHGDRRHSMIGPTRTIMRAIRPNSVIATIAVSFQTGPSPDSNASNAASSPERSCAKRPVAPPSLTCVSQPSNASAAIRGPSSAAMSLAAPSAARRMPMIEFNARRCETSLAPRRERASAPPAFRAAFEGFPRSRALRCLPWCR